MIIAVDNYFKGYMVVAEKYGCLVELEIIQAKWYRSL
jgi:hypothetical protein